MQDSSNPILEARVIVGSLTERKKLTYSWRVSEMTKRSLKLQIDFKNPIYVSMEEEPEHLEVTFNGAHFFVSEEGMPLDLTTSNSRLRLL